MALGTRVTTALIVALLLVLGSGERAGAADPQEAVGQFPSAGGVALVIWNGGPVDRLISASAARGCALRSVWVSVNGELLGYVPAAPGVVNAAFLATYPRAVLPTSTALVALCAPGTVAAPASGAPTLPSNVRVVVDPGVSAADEAFVRNGALAAEMHLSALFGAGLLGPNLVRIHADGATSQEIVSGVASCCYTLPRETHIYAAHQVWLDAGGTLPRFGFDARAYVMAHEFGHLWQGEIGCASSRVPAWIVEGSAEYIGLEAAVRAKLMTAEQRTRYDNAGAMLVAPGVTLASLESRDTLYRTSGAYGLSSVAISQLVAGQTPLALHDFCVDIATGNTWQAAFTKRFGKTPEAFYASFEPFRLTLR